MKSCQKLCCNHMMHQKSFSQCLKLCVGDLWHQQWISNTHFIPAKPPTAGAICPQCNADTFTVPRHREANCALPSTWMMDASRHHMENWLVSSGKPFHTFCIQVHLGLRASLESACPTKQWRLFGLQHDDRHKAAEFTLSAAFAEL